MTEYIYGTDDDGGHWLTGEVITRCENCENASLDQFGIGWCPENHREIRPMDYCSWSERKDVS